MRTRSAMNMWAGWVVLSVAFYMSVYISAACDTPWTDISYLYRRDRGRSSWLWFSWLLLLPPHLRLQNVEVITIICSPGVPASRSIKNAGQASLSRMGDDAVQGIQQQFSAHIRQGPATIFTQSTLATYLRLYITGLSQFAHTWIAIEEPWHACAHNPDCHLEPFSRSSLIASRSCVTLQGKNKIK